MKKKIEKVRYAVVGIGHIAQTAVLPGLKQARKNSELVALVTTDISKTRRVAHKYGSPKIVLLDQYQSLLQSGEVDAVYIALPNHMHYAFTKLALQNDVNVLCEKPFTGTSSEAEELSDIAIQRQLALMVAYRLHFDPANLKVIDLIRRGRIGDPRYFSSCFSFQVRHSKNIRLRAETDGGPLGDIGIYCINASRYIFRAEPTHVFARAYQGNDSQRFSEVPEMISVIMEFPLGRHATFTCSFGAGDISDYTVVGEKGYMQLKKAYEYASDRKLFVKSTKDERTHSFQQIDQFGAEITYFSDCVLKGEEPRPSAIEGASDLRVMEAIERSLRIGRVVPVTRSRVIAQRPEPSQARRMPAVRKPATIGVHSPH